ncbi:MAG: FkbM family methyltransferase [Planctomycetaceae bacterium]
MRLGSKSLAHHAKRLARSLIPAHVRFERAGRHSLVAGEREVHELSRLVDPGTIAIDVGALIGDYTYSLCKLVGPGGHVLCVEPQSEYARLLRAAAARLGLPMTVLECALSSRTGFAELCVPFADGRRMAGFASLEDRASAGRKYRVELRRLDDIAAEVEGRVSFIKVDVEGHELEVFKGGVGALKRHRPNLLVEIEQRHSPVPIEATFGFIREQGYTGYFLDDRGTRTPIGEFDPRRNHELIVKQSKFDDIPNGYISNFIFIPTR